MRPLPLLLAGLILLVVIALGFSVLLGRAGGSADGDPAPGSRAQQGEPGASAGPGESEGQGPATRGGKPQGHVYAGVTSEPEDVNPFTCHNAVGRRFVLGLTHEGLLDTDPVTGELRAAAAESWQLAEDGMSCTFVLRDGLKFSDGSAVTMKDVLFGWELASAGHLPLGFVADAFGRVAAAEAVDDRTLRLTFRERDYASTRAVGERWLVGKREFFVARVGELADRLGRGAPAVETSEFAALLGQIDRECGPGTGPMQLPSDADGPTTWRTRTDLELVRNPHHWRRAAEPGTWNISGKRLLFRAGPAVINALLEGEIDWLAAPSVDALLTQYPQLRERYRKLSYDYETLGVIGILWNLETPELRDRRVRRALAMLVDRDAIVAGHPDQLVPAFAFAKPGSAAYPTDLEPLAYDPRAARRLLREAGFDPAAKKPLRLTVLHVRDFGPMNLIADLLEHAAREAGVDLDVVTLEWSAWVARKVGGDWDGLIMNRGFRPWGDPFDFVHRDGVDNDGGWVHEEASRLAAAARVELDEAERNALWRELHAIVHREQPFAFAVHPRSCILFNRHIQDAEPGPRGLWPERWWVEPQHQRR